MANNQEMEQQKRRISEHALAVARLQQKPSTEERATLLRRIQDIEAELDLSAEEIATKAIAIYQARY